MRQELDGLNDSLTADNAQAFQFAYDSASGKYGYKVKEADTEVFVPFKSGGGLDLPFYVTAGGGSLSTQTSGNYSIKITPNKYNLTDATSISFSCSFSTSTLNYTIVCGVSETIPTSANEVLALENKTTGTAMTSKSFELDISNVSGDCYICFAVSVSGSSRARTATFSNIIIK